MSAAALLIVVQGLQSPCTTFAPAWAAKLLAFLAGAALGFLCAVELTPWAWKRFHAGKESRGEEVPGE